MNEENIVTLWVIYRHPIDFPQHYVVRPQTLVRGEMEPRKHQCGCLYTTLEEARRNMGDLYNLGRHPDDVPTIVEVWI